MIFCGFVFGWKSRVNVSFTVSATKKSWSFKLLNDVESYDHGQSLANKLKLASSSQYSVWISFFLRSHATEKEKSPHELLNQIQSYTKLTWFLEIHRNFHLTCKWMKIASEWRDDIRKTLWWQNRRWLYYLFRLLCTSHEQREDIAREKNINKPTLLFVLEH